MGASWQQLKCACLLVLLLFSCGRHRSCVWALATVFLGNLISTEREIPHFHGRHDGSKLQAYGRTIWAFILLLWRTFADNLGSNSIISHIPPIPKFGLRCFSVLISHPASKDLQSSGVTGDIHYCEFYHKFQFRILATFITCTFNKSYQLVPAHHFRAFDYLLPLSFFFGSSLRATPLLRISHHIIFCI